MPKRYLARRQQHLEVFHLANDDGLIVGERHEPLEDGVHVLVESQL